MKKTNSIREEACKLQELNNRRRAGEKSPKCCQTPTPIATNDLSPSGPSCFGHVFAFRTHNSKSNARQASRLPMLLPCLLVLLLCPLTIASKSPLEHYLRVKLKIGRIDKAFHFTTDTAAA